MLKRSHLKRAGQLKNISFRGVGQSGMDIYDVRFENGQMEWGFAFEADGKISGLYLRPSPLPTWRRRLLGSLGRERQDLCYLTNTRLSAGQRQMVAFARTFLTDPSVLILDQATLLDIPTERSM